MNISEITKDLNLPQISLGLLQQIQNKQISLPEFLTECAYWAIRNGFNELQPKQIPTQAEKVREYKSWSREKRQKLPFSFYEEFPEVKKHISQNQWVKNQNYANKMWLKEIFGYIPEKDYLTRKRIEERILDFEEI